MPELTGPENNDQIINPLNPIYLQQYLENFKKIMSRQMPNVSEATLYQDAFNQLRELLMTDEQKNDVNYLQQIVDVASQLEPSIKLEIPIQAHSESQRAEENKEEQEREKQRSEQVGREGKPLEEQLAEAISEERYEDAGEIQKKIDQMKTLMGGIYVDTLHRGEVRERNS